MFTISYREFSSNSLFSNYDITFMPGIKIKDIDSAKCMINVDTKVAYIYCD